MDRKEFIKTFGENPEDVLGPDWKNIIDEYLEDVEYEATLAARAKEQAFNN
jgi:hypothetical protein